MCWERRKSCKRISMNNEHNRLNKFLLTGAVATAIDFCVYMLLSPVIDISPAKAISMVTASVFSYVANKRYTFGDKRKTTVKKVLAYYLVFAVNLTVNVGVNRLVYDLTEWKLLAFAVATLCGTMVNYGGQRCWVFNCFNPRR